MGERRHLVITLAVACVAHAAVLAFVRIAPPTTAPVPPSTAPAGDVEIGLEQDTALAPEPRGEGASRDDERERRGHADTPGARRAEQSGARGGAGQHEAAPSGAPADEAPDVVSTSNGDGWSFRESTVDLGIDPRKRPLANGGGVASRAGDEDGPASSTGGLAEGLEALDVARGLGRGGVVTTAIHDAVQTSSVMGHAIFAVTIDASGAVTVGVSSASQDELGWSKLNESIRASVLARKDQIRIPNGARGLRIAVQAEAHEQYPNGVRPQDLGTRAAATGLRATETKDRIDIHLPTVGVYRHGKVCDVAVTPMPPFITGGCDPSNIGAVARRIVAARVVSETQM